MDLRSATRRREFEELKSVLLDMELYEEDMQLEEMRSLVTALNHTDATEPDSSEALLQDSDLDYLDALQPNDDGLMSSTVLDLRVVRRPSPIRTNPVSFVTSITPFSSPEVERPPEVMTVQAEVHHAGNWSPTESTESEAKGEDSVHGNEPNVNNEDSQAPSFTPTPEPVLLDLTVMDSGCGCYEATYSNSSSCSSYSNLDSNEAESHAVVGPSTPPYAYPHECSCGLDYIVNKENIMCYHEGSSSDNIDYDRDNLSEFSN